MLGKNGDQIYRMAGTPAKLLVLQHCHSVALLFAKPYVGSQ